MEKEAEQVALLGEINTENINPMSEPPEWMKEHFKDPHFFMQTNRGITFFRVTPAVYAELMGRPKKQPPHDHGER